MKAVIFDFWHTLACINRKSNPFREMFSVLGIDPLDYEDNIFQEMMIRKVSPEDCARQLLKSLDINMTPELVSRISSIIRKMENKNNQLFPETLPTLKRLKKMGIKTAILSNAIYIPEMHGSGYVPEEWGLGEYIDVEVFSFDIGIIKPDPIAFITVLKRLEVEPHEAMFIDDTPINVQAAKELGMTALLIDRENRHDFPNKIVSLNEIFKFL